MAAQVHLDKAPITEALIDLRVQLRDNYPVENLKELHESLRDQYPTVGEARRFQTSIEVKEGKDVDHRTVSQMVGYRFDSSDKLYVLQAHTDGFTVSRLKPYSTWEDLFGETKKLWAIFKRIAVPITISRVATRFINRIELSLDQRIDFDDYLAVPPRVPAGLPEAVSSFINRVAVEDPTTSASVVVTQALENPNPATNTIPVLLDIDVFKQVSMDPSGEDHWHLLGQLRQLKNQAFFGSITDKTLELLK